MTPQPGTAFQARWHLLQSARKVHDIPWACQSDPIEVYALTALWHKFPYGAV